MPRGAAAPILLIMGSHRWTVFPTFFLRLLMVAAVAMLGAFPSATTAQAAMHAGHAVMAGDAMAHQHDGAADGSAQSMADHGLACELLCLSVPAPGLFVALDPPVTLSLDLTHPAVSAARPGRDPDPAAHPPKRLPV